jgi:hydrogenase nickel incorporation protein HypA/HybF
MHELAVTQNILQIALKHAQEAEARRITDIYLVIGQLSSIVDDSVQFYWDLIGKDTIAEGARLHFERIPTEMQCLECGHPYSPAEGDLACPSCSSTRVKVVAGEEFYMKAIEVESEESPQAEPSGEQG